MAGTLKNHIRARPQWSPLNEDATESAFDVPLTLKTIAQQAGGYDVYSDSAAVQAVFDCPQALEKFLDLMDADPTVYTYEVNAEGNDDGVCVTIQTLSKGGPRFLVTVYIAGDYVVWDPYEIDEDEDGALTEVKRKIKINFRGKRRIKMQCKPGFRWDPAAKACVKIGGSELAVKRRSIRRSLITKRSMGSTFKRRVQRKTKKAMRFRDALGLKDGK